MESGLNMLARLRREIADPPPAPSDDVPAEALPEPTRKQYQNARRRRDPLGEGQPATWRLLLIKVAATVVVSCRRIVIRLSGSWPNQHFFERVRQSRRAGIGVQPYLTSGPDEASHNAKNSMGVRGRCAPNRTRGARNRSVCRASDTLSWSLEQR